MTATLTARIYTGASAGTESSPQTAIELCATDALTGPDVAPGSYSFERWLRLRVDVAPDVGVANFYVENEGELPDGVTIRFGVTDTPTTPKATVSSVATGELVSGRRYIFDMGPYADIGDHSRYLVLQAQVAAGADSGPIDTQGVTMGWQEA